MKAIYDVGGYILEIDNCILANAGYKKTMFQKGKKPLDCLPPPKNSFPKLSIELSRLKENKWSGI